MVYWLRIQYVRKHGSYGPVAVEDSADMTVEHSNSCCFYYTKLKFQQDYLVLTSSDKLYLCTEVSNRKVSVKTL